MQEEVKAPGADREFFKFWFEDHRPAGMRLSAISNVIVYYIWKAGQRSRIKVPDSCRSYTPEQLRNAAEAGDSQVAPELQKLLLEAASEIEGGEEAYTALVEEVKTLREMLALTKITCERPLGWFPNHTIDK